MDKLKLGYYNIDAISEALGILGDIHTTDAIITKEEQAIAEIKALGYQFLYYENGFVILVTAPKNIKYDKNRKYVVKDPLNLPSAKYNFLKETIEKYETKTAKYNCRKIHSKRMKMYTRSGYFLTEFLDAVAAYESDVALAIDEYRRNH